MPSAQTARARTAVFVVFAANGAIFASLASRFPDIKTQLALTPGQLGTTLLVGAMGALVGLPLSGRLNERVGAANTVRLGAALQLVAYVGAAAVLALGWGRGPLAAALFLGSLGMGIYDVAMNLEGAAVEKLLGRTVMPWFHAAFSGGTVVAALVGAGAAALRVSPSIHIAVSISLGVAAAYAASRAFLPRTLEGVADDGEPAAGGLAAGPAARSAWTEPRTLLVGVMVLVAALTEGTANDWVAVAFHEGHHLPTWAGVLAFAVFLTAMTLGRMLGAGMIDRFGRVVLLRCLFVAAAVGSLMVVFGNPPLAYAGAALWGVGASLGFPVGMSAAADEPSRASARMSVVSTIGYVAFLAGPPALGLLGDRVGVLHALLVVGVMAVGALLVVPAARPLDAR